MRAFAFVLSGLVALVGLSGCGKKTETKEGGTTAAAASGGKTGGIGLVDLDAVAKNVGRMNEMEAELKKQNEQLGENLKAQFGQLNQQLADEKSIIGDKPTEDQQKRLATLQGNLQDKWNTAQQTAGIELNKTRVEIINKFKDDAKEPVREVAKSLGLSAVFYKNDANVFLVVDDTIDITDAVTEKMKASGGSKPEAEKDASK